MSPALATIYREFSLELFRSPRYREAFVKAYLEIYTHAELEVLADLVTHPGYAIFLAKSHRLSEFTNPTFQQLFAEQQPRLKERLRQAGFE